ncbi:CHAT domain-containing protein [Aspergillus desertorum]
MDSGHFIGLVGRSLFAEEYLGDLEAAADYLQQTQPRTSEVEPAVYAEYLCCSVVHSVLIGRPADAYESLKALEGLLGQLPKEWGLRYTNYKVLADYTRRYPPSLRFYHEIGRPVNIPMLGDIGGLIDISDSLLRGCNTYFPDSLPGDQTLSLIMNGVIGFPMRTRDLAARFHPLAVRVKSNDEEEEDVRTQVVKAAEPFVKFRDMAYSNGLSEMGTYMFRLCEGLKDYAGMANAKMLEADNLISPPFASPVTLNLVIVDVSHCTQSNALWDSVEYDLTHEYVPGPRNFTSPPWACSVKRRASAARRPFYFDRVVVSNNKARHERTRKKQALELLAESDVKLQESLKLFGRDEANAQLVKAHLILLDITGGNARNVKAIARSIGVWGFEAKNEIVVHCIAIIMSRYAHQEWSKFSNMETAFLAWECAFEVCEPVGDIIAMFQSVVSRAYVHNEMLNPVPSQIFIEEGLSMVDRLLEYFDCKDHSAPETSQGSEQRLLPEHLQMYNEWNSKFAYWMEHDESFTTFRERLENGEVKHLVHNGFSLPQKKMKGLWRQFLADDAAMVRYGSANFKFRRLLEEGDIIKAEASFRHFVDEAMSLEKGYCRDLSCVIACDRIGDSVKAREILDSTDDNDLFKGQLEEMQQGIGTSFDLVAENALVCAVLAGDKARARRIIDMIIKIWPSFFEKVSESTLEYSRRLSYYAQVMNDEAPEICFAKLLEARQIIETCRIQTKDLDARIGSSNQAWATEVFMNLAHICLRWDGEGVPVNLISGYEHGNLDAFHVSEISHKRRLLRSLLALKKLSPEQEKEVSQLRKIDDLEKDGNLSHATTFIETVNSTIEPRLLYQSIDENAVVIDATFGARGFISFAVTREGIQKVHKGTTSVVDIRRPIMQAMQIMRDMTGYIGEEEVARKKALNQLSQEISAVLLSPFAEIIRDKSHVIFSVSDPMTAFPFASLVFDGKPLVMHAAVSQVPSLTVLHHLSQRESASMAPTVSVLAKSPTQEPPENASRSTKEANLHMAGIEAVNIARMFGTWPIEASHMTREDFRKYVKGGPLIMHIGTHGDLNYRNPLLSSISIGDGQEFRVIDMSTVRSSVQLLVFAACLSGLGKATIGSEVLGFSHVVLSTGCQAYIRSLWKVSDFGSMLIMTLFYRHLRSMPHLSVAELMRKAQMDLLQLDKEKVSLLLKDMLHDWTATKVGNHSPAEFVPDAEFILFTLKMIIDQLDWSSPFYWAPFTLVGYGGLRFVHDVS